MNARESGSSSAPKTTVSSEFTLEMEQTEDYAFRVRFDKEGFAPLTMDESAPIGKGSGPDASRMLAAAVGHCLSASLLFCLHKSRVGAGPIRTRVRVQHGRNERGRLRLVKIEVEIDPQISEAERQTAQRCREIFEDYCVVTQSVRHGIPVEVTVKGFEELRGHASK